MLRVPFRLIPLVLLLGLLAGTGRAAGQTPPDPTTCPGQATSAPATGLDPETLLGELKLTADNLPDGYQVGGLAAEERNAQAVAGFADPDAALSLQNSTGRQIGYVEQVSTPSSGSAGISIEVWADANGASAWMDNYPDPEADLSPERLDPPQPVGDATILYRFTQGTGTIYSLTWQRGQVILSVGESFAGDSGALDALMQTVNVLDAQATQVLGGD